MASTGVFLEALHFSVFSPIIKDSRVLTVIWARAVCDDMFATLKNALRQASPTEIQEVLDAAQPYITDGPTAEAADRLATHLVTLTEAAVKLISEALAEDEPDPRVLEPLSTQYAEYAAVPDVATLLSELRKKMSALQQGMRNKVRDEQQSDGN